MIEQLKANYEKKRKFFLMFFIVFLLSIILLSYLNYKENKEEFIQNINHILKATVYDTKLLLGEDFFKRAISPDAITPKEDFHNIEILTKLAKNHHIAYVYSFYFQNGVIHFTTSSATDKELKTKTYTKYWDIYDEATPKLKNIFHDFKPFYEFSSDRWGSFKSILVPFKTDGISYVIGADISTDYIDKQQRSFLIKTFLFIGFNIGLILFLWLKFSKISHDEIKIIGNIQNSLNATIEKKTKELQELNANLQTRVEEEIEKNREKEKQLLAQSRLAQMGEILGMISHQWRQPLNAISATSSIINIKAQRGQFDKEKTIELSKKISTLTQQLSQTIDEFKDFFKPKQDKKDTTYTQLVESVMQIVKDSLQSKNIQIITDLQSDVVFHTYATELLQVLLNLIKNAEDALLENEVKDPYIKISSYGNTLTVSDNAGGIPEDIVENIFDPYFSTKDLNGTGLGLYMSKTIVENHCGGKLSVTNSTEGAVFSIEL